MKRQLIDTVMDGIEEDMRQGQDHSQGQYVVLSEGCLQVLDMSES